MTYVLAIGDRSYSSWSLRAWLVFAGAGLPVALRQARLYSDEFPRLLAGFAPARTVPALRLPGGAVVWDSLAIVETLAERHPEAAVWPADPALRALARSLAAEMHGGFEALRATCPQNLRVGYADFVAPAPVCADLARIAALWSHALAASGGPWLCGAWGAVDAFFAPVAGRIATYGLPVPAEAAAYVAGHLAHPAFRAWRAAGLAEGPDQPSYARPHLTRRPWPGPAEAGEPAA